MAGRKPLPTQMHVLHGNPGKRARNAKEPKPRPGLPPVPKHLSPRAKAAWKRIGPELVAMNVMSLADGPALELLCDAYAEWRHARDLVDQEGATYETETENGRIIRANPAVAIASDAWRRIRAMLAEFGLTPSSRSRVSMLSGSEDVDPFDAFLRGGTARRA